MFSFFLSISAYLKLRDKRNDMRSVTAMCETITKLSRVVLRLLSAHRWQHMAAKAKHFAVHTYFYGFLIVCLGHAFIGSTQNSCRKVNTHLTNLL